MTLLVVARLCALWTVMNVQASAVGEVGPIRLIATPTTHVGVRFHSDAIGDEAITVQVTATWLSL